MKLTVILEDDMGRKQTLKADIEGDDRDAGGFLARLGLATQMNGAQKAFTAMKEASQRPVARSNPEDDIVHVPPPSST